MALPELWVGYLMPGKYSQNVGNTRLVASPATELRLREILQTDPDVVAVNLSRFTIAWRPSWPSRWC